MDRQMKAWMWVGRFAVWALLIVIATLFEDWADGMAGYELASEMFASMIFWLAWSIIGWKIPGALLGERDK